MARYDLTNKYLALVGAPTVEGGEVNSYFVQGEVSPGLYAIASVGADGSVLAGDTLTVLDAEAVRDLVGQDGAVLVVYDTYQELRDSWSLED